MHYYFFGVTPVLIYTANNSDTIFSQRSYWQSQENKRSVSGFFKALPHDKINWMLWKFKDALGLQANSSYVNRTMNNSQPLKGQFQNLLLARSKPRHVCVIEIGPFHLISDPYFSFILP